ncbi:hypothetical protein SETIT_3G277200v2 [Setaria italica]|uniref:Uncharacterized protein n=1 Tax=Setaria italica TaxID=4555 RepID=A0A368QK91_SETIT|nr:hypothetical protein SETIT_3G277200v2 [Setaria italica]
MAISFFQPPRGFHHAPLRPVPGPDRAQYDAGSELRPQILSIIAPLLPARGCILPVHSSPRPRPLAVGSNVNVAITIAIAVAFGWVDERTAGRRRDGEAFIPHPSIHPSIPIQPDGEAERGRRRRRAPHMFAHRGRTRRSGEVAYSRQVEQKLECWREDPGGDADEQLPRVIENKRLLVLGLRAKSTNY